MPKEGFLKTEYIECNPGKCDMFTFGSGHLADIANPSWD